MRWVDLGVGDDTDALELVRLITRCAVDRVADELDAELAAPPVVGVADGLRFAIGWHHLDGPSCSRLPDLERVVRAFARAADRSADIALENRVAFGRLVFVERDGRRWPVLDLELRRGERRAVRAGA